MKRFPAVLILPVLEVCLSGCAETNEQQGSALDIERQDSSATVPGNSPMVDRMGVRSVKRPVPRVQEAGA